MTKRMYLINTGDNMKVGYISIDDLTDILGFRIAAYDIKKISGFKKSFELVNFGDNGLITIELIVDRNWNGKFVKDFNYLFRLKKDKLQTFLSVFRRDKLIDSIITKDNIKKLDKTT